MRILLGLVPDQLVRVYAVFARSGRNAPDEAVFAGHEKLLRHTRDELLRRMAVACAGFDPGSSRSLAMATKIADRRTRVLAFAEIGETVRTAGHMKSAIGIARKAADQLDRIDVDWWRVEAAGRVAELFIRAGASVPQTVRDTLVAAAATDLTGKIARARVALANAEMRRSSDAETWLRALDTQADEEVLSLVAVTHAVLGHRKRGLELARRLLKRAGEIDTGSGKADEALSNAARVFVMTGDTASAIKCAAFVDDADRVVRDALQNWLVRPSRQASSLQEANFLKDACRDPNTRQVRPQLIARVASYVAGAGRVAVARLLIVEALAAARLEGRFVLYRTLTSGAGALSAVSPGDCLMDLARGVLDVESWWEHAPGEATTV